MTMTEDLTTEETEAPKDEEHSRSLLRIWKEVLSNVDKSSKEDVSIGIAGRVVAGWPQISFQEVPVYHRIYHEYLVEIRDILHDVIAENPGNIDFMSDVDLEENGELYRELVISWNVLLDAHEMDWRAEHPESHIIYAALVDVRGFLFGQTGLAGHLDALGFTLDSEEIADEIAAAREVNGE